MLPKQQIGMISEGSRDIEDWSNDAENENKWKLKTVFLHTNKISHFYYFFIK